MIQKSKRCNRWMDEEKLPKIVIESNIPIPNGRKRMNAWQNLLCKMKVGQSFCFDADNNMQKMVYRWAKNVNVRIKSQREDDEKLRIWKVSGPVIGR